MLTTFINGEEYNLATTLRVAFMVQGQHNHKPYTDVFKNIGDMIVEDQIGIIYAAFVCANPGPIDIKTGKNKPVMSRQAFTDYYLDNYNLKDLMEQLQEIIQGIMGTDLDDEPSVGVDEDEEQGE